MNASLPALSYQHISPELRLYQGEESLSGLKRELERNKCSRAVIVCGRTISRSDALASLRERLGSQIVEVIPSARENSPVRGVEDAAKVMQEASADAIIAVGGGSAAVTARAAAILAAENKPLAQVCTQRLADGKFESPRLNAPKVPLFVVPTTPSTAFVKAGTAVHSEDGDRLAMFDPKTRARAIFIHPEFVSTAPTQLVTSATLNTFSTGVEALESPKCDPISEAFLMQAIRLITQNLPGLADGDVTARQYLVVAGVLCGRGTEQTGAGLASVLAHAIGHRSHVANGIVNGIVLPHTMRYNASATTNRTRSIVGAVSSDGTPHSVEASAVVERFLRSLPVPRRLSEISIEPGNLQEIADAAMLDWFITRAARPVKDAETVVSILQAAL
jgi:alcohol dehydrogenase class IV